MQRASRIEKELHQTKVIIRRLPPDFTEEDLKNLVSPFPPNDYFYFVPGNQSDGPHGCSRAYVNFTDESQIMPFRDQYDGTLLESKKKIKYRVIIEYAPFQGIPKKSKRREDTRCGTIEQDSDYQAFLQSLQEPAEPNSALDASKVFEEYEAARKGRGVQITPLIEYLMEKKTSRSKHKVYSADKERKRPKGDTKARSKAGRSTGDEKRQDSSRTEDTRRKDQKYLKSAEEKTSTDDRKGSGRTKRSEVASSSRSAVSLDDSKRESQNKASDYQEKRKDSGKSRKSKDKPDRALYTPRHHRGKAGEGDSRKEKSRDEHSYRGEGHNKGEHGYEDSGTRSQRKGGSHGDRWYSDRDGHRRTK